jgi:hypothetical protein
MEDEEPLYRRFHDPYHRWFPYVGYSGYEGNSSYGAPLEMSTAAFHGSTLLRRREYDVFINHGMSFEMSFVEQLCCDLYRFGGFRTFFNTMKIFPTFEENDKARKGALVHVAIFSKGYAESYDCLDELCEMLKSEQQIIPVFYDVKSIDLQRIEDGPYKEAFINHQKRGRAEKIPIWKEALRKVVDYKGFEFDKVHG